MVRALKALKLWQMVVLVVVILGTAAGVFGIYNWFSGPGSTSLPTNTQLVPVQYGDLVNTVSASGSLVFSVRERLTFGSAGTVQEVSVKEGDTVKEGQVLARLDGAALVSLQKAVTQARINLRNAEENLGKAQNPHGESDIAQAELAVINAKISLKTAQENLEKAKSLYTAGDMARAEVQVETAQVNLDNAGQDLADTQKEWETKIKEAEDQLSEAEEAYKEVFRNYFGMELTEGQLWQEPDTLFAQANIDPIVLFDMRSRYSMSEAEEVLRSLSSQAGGAWNPNRVLLWQYMFPAPPSGQDIIDEAQEAWEALTEVKDQPQATRLRAEKAIAAAEGKVDQAEDALTQAEEDLAAMKAGPDPLEVEQKQKQVALAQANLTEAEETLAEIKSSPDPLEVEQKQKQVAVAQANLTEAEETLAEIKSPDPLEVEQKQKQVALAQANLTEAEETLAEIKSSPDPLEVELRQLEVAGAQAALEEALRRLEMATLVAPFTGIVASISVEAGQAVSASTVVVELVEPSMVEVSAILDEIDVAQVRQGQRVSVSLDALPDVELLGRVSAISPVARVQAGVVSFPVTIEVTPSSEAGLWEGMSATASIVVQEVNNVLLIPRQAVSGSLNNPVVKVMVDGQPQERPVKLGASDDLWIEVMEGLREGEVVVVVVAEASTTQQGFPGGFRGFPGGDFPGGGMMR